MNPSPDIVSVGMVTAVGLDAPSSCAAMRARLDGFRETRFNGPRGGRLVGAPVPLPRNWIGEKRLAHMAAGAISEAFKDVPEARHRAALILCLAEPDRPEMVASNPENLSRRIVDMIGFKSSYRPRIIRHGRPSGHVALVQAKRILSSGQAPFVMIAGVDSYLSTRTILRYVNDNRILAPHNPNGFIPGEAAAAIILTRSSSAPLRLVGLGLAREPATIYNPEDRPLRGNGMTAAYRAALDETGIEMSRIGFRIADLIGESYWFKQSALANLRLVRGAHAFQDLWSPAESLGNVGAAVVPIMIGMAWIAVQKGYAAGNPILIEASNDDGACGAAIVAAVH
jgi:3-oxoacyl-[acyl-carrier-protein] synthase-1